MVLIWSSQSQVSDQVKRELTLAVNASKIIIPYKIDNAEPIGSFAYYLTNTHWLDAVNLDDKSAMKTLAYKINLLLEPTSFNMLEDTDGEKEAENESKTENAGQRSTAVQIVPQSSLLINSIEAILDDFSAGDESLFKTYRRFENSQKAAKRVLANHGISREDSKTVHLFINTSTFRSKNGIVACDNVLSVKDFWERPVHFEICNSSGRLLEIEATVEKGASIVLTIKRLDKFGEGEEAPKLLRTFTISHLDDDFLQDPNKSLIEKSLPRLVRNLGQIQRQRIQAGKDV